MELSFFSYEISFILIRIKINGLILSIFMHPVSIFAVESYNSFNVSNCIGLHSSCTLKSSQLFIECFDTRRRLFVATFVGCFHSYKILVIIVSVEMKPFNCTSIFKVFLTADSSNLRTLDNFQYHALVF